MLTLEQYASIYLPMMAATGNALQEQEICTSNGYTLAQWQEAKDFYTSKMMDVNDMGKTAMAFSAAMMKGAAPVPRAPQTPTVILPGDFIATKILIYVSEYDIQMVELINPETTQRITMQLGFDANDDFEKNYINGRVHICINHPNHNIYGGVSKVELSSNAIKFILDEEGKERMLCSSVTATLNMDGKMYNYLKRKMQFMYKSILEIKQEATPTNYIVNGITLNDEWKTFETNSMKVSIRPNLQNIIETGKYPTIVNIDFNSTTIGQNVDEMNLLNAMEASLKDSLEYDLSSVIAFHMTTNDNRRFYIYSSLPQEDFMKRINDAFRLLPQMPLGFSGGNDEKWENYTACLNDLNNH